MLAFEAAGYQGLYHVLMGRLAPLEGVKAQDLTIRALMDRCKAAKDVEVCLATSPDLEGEATAEALRESLRPLSLRVTRIARGLPAGAAIPQVQAQHP